MNKEQNMREENSTWKHGFMQKIGLETDQERASKIIKENYKPNANRIDIACRLVENVNDKDRKLVFTKRQLIDLVLKNDADSEQEIKRLLNLYKGRLNGFVSHVRQELK